MGKNKRKDRWYKPSKPQPGTGIPEALLPKSLLSESGMFCHQPGLKSFDEALDEADAATRKGFTTGLLFAVGNGIVIIHVLSCRDPSTGLIDATGSSLIKRFASYTEVSQDGTGIHICLSIQKDAVLPKKNLRRVYGEPDETIEVFLHNHFSPCTGDIPDGYNLKSEMPDRTEELLQFIRDEFPEDNGEAIEPKPDVSGSPRDAGFDPFNDEVGVYKYREVCGGMCHGDCELIRQRMIPGGSRFE